MVSIKTTQVDYFIPALETVHEIRGRIKKSDDGFIVITLPDETEMYVNSNHIIQFLEIKEEDLQPPTEE